MFSSSVLRMNYVRICDCVLYCIIGATCLELGMMHAMYFCQVWLLSVEGQL